LLDCEGDLKILRDTHVGATFQPVHQPESSQALDLLMAELTRLGLSQGECIGSECLTEPIEHLGG